MVGVQVADSITNSPFKVSTVLIKPSDIVIPIAGINMVQERAEVVRSLYAESLEAQREGKILYVTTELVPEPTNPYDAKAVAILLNKKQVGYVSKSVQSLLDNHYPNVYTETTPAKITDWGCGDDGNVWCNVQIIS